MTGECEECRKIVSERLAYKGHACHASKLSVTHAVPPVGPRTVSYQCVCAELGLTRARVVTDDQRQACLLQGRIRVGFLPLPLCSFQAR